MSVPFHPGVWFFPDAPVTEIRENIWLIGEKAVCKRWTDKQALAREIRLCGHLEDCGLPVPSTLRTVDELDWHAYQGSFYHLMNRLPGGHVRYPLSEPERFGALFGGTLRRLHGALASCSHADSFRENDLCGELEGWVSGKFAGREDLLADIRETAHKLRCLSPALPRQLIHRDFHAGNLLFEGDRLTGLLDFELVRTDFRVFDLAYLLSSTLGDNWRQPAYWQRFLRFAHTCAGAYGPTESECEAVAPMMRAICLLFAGFWRTPEQIESTVSLERFLGVHEDELRAL